MANRLFAFFNRSKRIANRQVAEILNQPDADQIILALSVPIQKKVDETGFNRVSTAERVFYCVYWLEAEVNNGGFHQFFYNSSGDYALETAAALAEIGAVYTKQLLEQAFTVFPQQAPPKHRGLRQQQLLAISEDQENFLSSLDEKFYLYVDPIGSLLVDYLRLHQKTIRL